MTFCGYSPYVYDQLAVKLIHGFFGLLPGVESHHGDLVFLVHVLDDAHFLEELANNSKVIKEAPIKVQVTGSSPP